MATKSIVEELYDKINEETYKESVAPLSIDDKLPDHIFQKLKTTMKGRYRFNYDLFSSRRGTVKPNGIFELFVKYCGETVDKVRERLVDYVHSNTAETKKLTAEYFKKKGGDLMMWLYKMSRPSTAGDELTLFLLCKIFTRHAVIHTLMGPWSTLNMVKTAGSLENRCDIVLVYIVYGFCEAVKIDTSLPSPSQTITVATASPVKTKAKTQNARCTLSISDLLVNVHEKELKEQEALDKQKQKQRKLGLSEENVLPTGHKKYNTRDPTPMRKRQNERTKRESVKNKCYSDNLDDFHLEAPKRRRKQNLPSRLRSPSNIRMEAQRIIKTENQGQKVMGTAIKNEQKEEKPVIELNESEMRRIEAKNKERNKNKKWPDDARLVHIDGTPCSRDCMKNSDSDYHKELDEIEFNRIKSQKQQEKLTVATPDLNTNAIVNNTNSPTSVEHSSETIDNDSIPVEKQTELEELTVATPIITEKTSTEIANINDEQTADYCRNGSEKDIGNESTMSNLEPANHTTPNSSENELPADKDVYERTGATNLTKFVKKYDINKSTKTASIQELPDIPEKITTNALPNLESTTPDYNPLNIDTTVLATDHNLPSVDNSHDINLPTDDLPLMEHTEFPDDFEMLMDLETTLDNTHLEPLGDEITNDKTNQDDGLNQDLEVAMDSVATSSFRTGTVSREHTPVSPRGSFRTKTHGIRKLTPEERKDKTFKCEECEFSAYSRKGVSDHYTDRHGSCFCEYCERNFSNPHALKRHQYDHSTDKQYQCKDCDQEFYFQSELTAHRIKHRENPSFLCMANGCGKKFFRNSDLNAHVPVHSGVLHRCDHPGCTYSNLDKRLVTGHKRVHSDKKTFKCKYVDCDKTFKHTNARLRHYKRDH